MKELDKLIEYKKRIEDKQYVSTLLDWDLRVNAPRDSKDHLIEVSAEASTDVFNLLTDDSYGKLIDDVINSRDFDNLDDNIKKAILLEKDRYELLKKVPENFNREYNKTCNMANKVWEEAKEENDYNKFLPYLKKVIDMTKEYYRYMTDDVDLYNFMIQQYSRGMDTKTIDKLFEEIKTALIPLIKEISTDKVVSVNKNYSDSELMDASRYLLNYIGFDMNRGGLGIYPHGFTTTLACDDIRIAFSNTSNPNSFSSTVIHEGGHGIYEQCIDKKLRLLQDGSLEDLLDVHESQSRFYENILGRNKNFWIPIYDDIKKLLKLDVDIDDFVKMFNQVSSGKIRVDADEVTYALHIILRYEIERDIFNGDLEVEDLPKVWNKKMKEYLSVDVKNDSEGVLQDVHWSEGLFGYFPSYLLGNIYDGMFLEAIEENLGSVDELLRSGNIKKITKYLNDNIHKNGGVYNSCEIIEKMCGKEISSKPIIDYYYKKYKKES